MTIVVIGASGLVATALAASAAPEDALIALGRPALDLTRPATIEAALNRLRPKLVINAAGYTHVDRAESEPGEAQRLNVDGPALLAAACAKRETTLIHLSTDYVFSGAKSTPYREDDAAEPLSVYGHSKLQGEGAVLERCPRALIVRTSGVFAPHGRNFVRAVLGRARTQQRVRVVRDQRSAPTYAADLADALLAIFRRVREDRDASASGGLLHVCGPDGVAWSDFAAMVFAGAAARGGPSAEIEPVSAACFGAPARRPAQSQLNCGEAAMLHGIQLPPLAASLAACLDIMAAEGWSLDP